MSLARFCSERPVLGRARKSAERSSDCVLLTNPPRVLLVDLFDIAEREDWADEVLKHSQITDWLESKDQPILYLWLDGLDENPWRTESLLKALYRALEQTWKPALSRLRLRIISRPLAWNEDSTQSLQEIWKEQQRKESREGVTSRPNVCRCELCPLRAVDVHNFALASGLDAKEFWRQIVRLKAHNFALRPRTLILLASKFDQGELQSRDEITRADLFALFIRKSCEPTPGRSKKGQAGQLLPERKMQIAERLAAFSLLCIRPLLCDSGSTEARVAKSELRFGETIPHEWSEDHTFWQDRKSLEVFDTPIFTSQTHTESDTSVRKVHRFAERTDAEYLAARYLSNHQIEDAQILSLLCHSVSDVPGQDN